MTHIDEGPMNSERNHCFDPTKRQRFRSTYHKRPRKEMVGCGTVHGIIEATVKGDKYFADGPRNTAAVR